MTRLIAVIVSLVLLQILSARAQSPAQPREAGVAVNCTPTTTSSDPSSLTTTGRSEALGDKLARSDGVLCPPAGVDPDIRAPTPDAGIAKTPVIPPPGSPGGDPGVRPK